MSPTIRDEPANELADVLAGRLPQRYSYRLQDVFMVKLAPLLRPGVRILDVGAGAAPTLAPDDRPPGCFYAGLDASAQELAAAGAGAYDEVHVHDIARPFEAVEPFDLAISWQVLEHVSPIGAALKNLRVVLKPQGALIAQVSGSKAWFSLAARAIPHAMRAAAMTRLLGHSAAEKFPLARERRDAASLERQLSDWSHSEVIAFYRGAAYLSPWRAPQRVYLAYENRIARGGHRNLATHYLLVAQR